MKAIILLLALATVPTLTHARHRPAIATFSAEGSFDVRISINGQLVNRRPARHVKSFPLRPGRHMVFIKAIGPRQTRTLRQTVIVRSGTQPVFAVRSRGRGRNLYLEPVGVDRYPSRRARYQGPVHQQWAPTCYEAQHFPVKHVVREMYRQHHDRRKLQIAKDAICTDMLLADDLRRMMHSLDFDESRIELAVYAHDRVCNVQDFHIVYGALDFHQSTRQLERRLGYI